ncbi:MAG: hypothetical protein GY842_00470 [bacterium]|nr:hypothetical protein [bacterium]
MSPSLNWIDGAFLLLLGAFWVYAVLPIVTPERRYGGDVLRDVASAINIQHGQVFADPVFRGETIWYPPLGPIIVAGVSKVVGVSPTDCYVWSQLLFNWAIPFGLYLLVRMQWGRRAAMGATIALCFALPWWQSSICRGQASVHAVVWGWVALLLYVRQHRRASLGWAAACGVFQGIAFWHHPLLPAVLGGTFVLQALWSCHSEPAGPDRRAVVRRRLGREVLILSITLVVAAPVLYLMLHGPVLNPEPRGYIADEFRGAEFALMRYRVWIWGAGLVGLVCCLRSRSVGGRLLVGAVAVCVAGQLPGYARVFEWPGASRLPVVVPHEFQMLFQLGWAVCVGVGLDRLLTWLAGRGLGANERSGRRTALTVGLTLAALGLTGGGGIPDTHSNLRRFLHHYGPGADADFRGAAEWVRERTDINDMFMCSADLAFGWLSPETGRKCWIAGHGHSNPRVDRQRRAEVLERMAVLSDPAEFWDMARKSGVDYCILAHDWRPHVLTDPALGPQAVPRYLRPVYVSPKVHILKVVSQPHGVGSVTDTSPANQ